MIGDPAVAASGGFTYSATAGATASAQTVAVFTDPGGAEAVGDYSANINWGDGTTAAGTISLDPTTHVFTVSGQHDYAQPRSYSIQVALNHDSAQAATVASTAEIANASTSGGPVIAATAVPVTGYEQSELTGATVATFTDGDGSLPAADFTSAISWGDGTSSSGTISASGGNYTVTGSHTYLDEGHYAVQVSIGPAAGDAAAVGSAATVSATATIHEELLAEGGVGTPNQNFIQEIYRDVFGRAAEPQGRDYWVSKLAAGQTRLQVTTAMVQLAFPREFQRDTVDTLYQQYLGRAPDAAGNAYWTAFLYGGGTAEQMSQAIINSPEFWKLSGATDSGFLDALFRDALGRAIDPSALTYFQGQMAHGATPFQVAAMIFASDEYAHVRADALIEQFLDRPADPTTADPIAAQLAQGETDEHAIAQLLASDEYFAKTQI